MKVLILSDNKDVLTRFRKLRFHQLYDIEFAYSYRNKEFNRTYGNKGWIKPVDVNLEASSLIQKYSLIISLHFKDILPKGLVKAVRCVNVHPGFNPYNRGWFPHVFSITNGLPCGVTIHEMDCKIDRGPIIIQRIVKVEKWETSAEIYDKILDLELSLLEKNFERILKKTYKAVIPKRGNINYKKDYEKLCQLDLKDVDTFENHLNKLRALSHRDYWNAYFVTEGKKVYVKISFKVEEIE